MTSATPTRCARVRRELLGLGERNIRLQIDGEIDRVLEVSRRHARVGDEELEAHRQRESDRDDQQRENAGQRIANETAERAEEGLRMARGV